MRESSLSRDDLVKNRARGRGRSTTSLSHKNTQTHPLHIHEVNVEFRSLRSTHLLRHILQKEFVIQSRSRVSKVVK